MLNRYNVPVLLVLVVVFFTQDILTPGERFAILSVTWLWFFPAGLVNDPFWFLRKRLWTNGSFYVRRNSVHESEPFIWSAAPVPVGADIYRLLDD